ncbi:ferritin-like domain-containing protein [Conexibacter woesei]|uniref:Ferritin-like domain-containing protein n=1 Tax=Conexibacter woesei (strain DSM 14684 / CCUG 47730 / CIP 108061 / JCM 11494 / NBRC 100937 / ID131577) TaxID=469383 RepID=D3EZI8_CONWI|nr:ferritin-like domain-containing protein [Conexibacter woesei]ADB53826.1 hypothetical protein Cwoe_5421 [Conexibacter woesei DSM 14684]
MTSLDGLLPFDRDGALAETCTRAQLLRGAAAVGGAAALGAAGSPARAAESPGGDVAILNYALTLEELQAAFYSEAEQAGALDGALARQATVVGGHERAHVTALRSVLARRAIAKPAFDFGGVTERPEQFRATAVAFEDLAVAVYKDQAPRIASREYLAAAIAIASVEARHAAWIRRLAGRLPAADAFDEPLPRAEALRLVRSTGFIAERPRTEGRRRPRFTG